VEFRSRRGDDLYDPYAVGAYAEGAFSCSVPYVTLRPLARSDFPLP